MTTTALFKEAEAFPPLIYEKGGGSTDLAFRRAPERLFDEPDECLIWAHAALGGARRVAAKRPASKRRSKSRDK
jgi:DNA transformation protein